MNVGYTDYYSYQKAILIHDNMALSSYFHQRHKVPYDCLSVYSGYPLSLN
ncbi:TPA: hypothetical protein ACGZ92_003224 [Elizabethkingia anophelis]